MKILFLQEYIRQNHVFNKDGQSVVDYKRTDAGKKLTELLSRIGVNRRDYAVDYDYDMIPEAQKVDQRTGRVIKYKTPVAKLRKEPEARLLKRLMAMKPDIIIPTGEMGCKNLLGVASITKARGVPVEKTIEDPETGESFNTVILPMFSMEYLAVNPNIENLVTADMSTLAKFIESGIEAFASREVNYELVTSINRVEEIFKFLFDFKPVTAWDLETNTLRSDMLGAKPLVTSLSWAEAQGVTIPLEHHEANWSEEELNRIYFLLERFLEDKNQIKVGHNI